MVLVTCRCGKDFITEADPYMVIPHVDKEIELNCGCYIFPQKDMSTRALIISLASDTLRIVEMGKEAAGAKVTGDLKTELSAIVSRAKLSAKMAASIFPEEKE